MVHISSKTEGIEQASPWRGSECLIKLQGELQLEYRLFPINFHGHY